MANTYSVPNLSFEFKADSRYSDLSYTEQKRGYRVIGGNKGDVRFNGFSTDSDGTELSDVRLVTGLEDLTEAEAAEIAREVVDEAYESIGAECVEHS